MSDEKGPAWVVLGREDIGFHEVGQNQGIERFIGEAHCGSLGDPWCAIWANAKLEVSKIGGTRSPAAQSFCHHPDFVQLAGPAFGAIVVYWRESPGSGKGHVGFYIGETATGVLTLGGNEGDAVREEFEPKSQLIGYWWPKSVPLPQIGAIAVPANAGSASGKVV